MYQKHMVTTEEQLKTAIEMVIYSLVNHTVSNIWDKKEKNIKKDFELRLTGTLGEIVFADFYNLKRPEKSFGAADGQDYGLDFQIKSKGNLLNVDTKTMRRQYSSFKRNYVFNIPCRQAEREDSKTDIYFLINLIMKDEELDKLFYIENKKIHIKDISKLKYNVYFMGHIYKNKLINNDIGIFYPEGTERTNAARKVFTFLEDTYEVFFHEINKLNTD